MTHNWILPSWLLLNGIEQIATERANAMTAFDIQRLCFRIANACLPLQITPAIRKAIESAH